MEESAAVLPLGPWALAAVATVLVVALSVPPGGPRPADTTAAGSPVGRRAGAAVLAALAVAAVLVARLGPASDLRNPVPALVVGLAWPLLLLLPGLVGLVRPARDADGPDDVRPAVVAALAVAAFLTVPLAPTRPAAVATAVAAYALVVAATAVAFGAATAARLEVLGLLARWGALGRRLPRWAAPRGALAVLAVLLGGAWFERYERSTAWTADLPGREQTLVGLAAALVLGALGAAALQRATRSGAPGTAAAVLLPLALATAAAGVLRRALISVQLLVDQASSAPRAVDPDPLGVAGGQALALALVVVGGSLAGAVLARRMGEETARLPGVGVLLLLTGASAWVVLQP